MAKKTPSTKVAPATKKNVPSITVPASAAPALRTSPPPKVTHDMIARKAYEIWERKGRPIGKDLENWQDAQKALGLL